MQKNLQAVVLVAGKSTRFNTNQTKLIEKICGQEMILYITKILEQLDIKTTLVVGYQREIIESLIKKNHGDSITFSYQEHQLGTGHALLTSKYHWSNDHILVLNGDIPLITKELINDLYKKHIDSKAAISFVVAHNIDPALTSYGRVIQENNKIRIVEAKDDKEEKKDYCCINAGIYLIKKDFLSNVIHNIEKSKVTGEFYITELISMASGKDLHVETLLVPFDIVRGINTLHELWVVEQIKRAELIKYWMERGIRFSLAQNSHVDINVSIEPGTYIGAGVQLYGNTKIGRNCRIDAFSIIENSIIEDNTIIRSHSIMQDSKIKRDSKIGPFAYINSNALIKSNYINDLVDINKEHISQDSEIKFVEEDISFGTKQVKV